MKNSATDEFSVLIVEDDIDARRNMEDILSLDGYRVRSESRCLTAIVAVESTPFDAVIVDWRLPDQNADQLIPIICGRQPDTPVVVVTGLRDFETAVKALRSGAYDFLLKPINPDALRSVLNRIVERKQHLQKIEAANRQLLINERLAAIGQMVAGLAHESRNAFQRSHACLEELALDLKDMPDSLQLVHKVQRALDDLHYLLEEVRDYSAPIILERRPCNLQSLVQQTWSEILDTSRGKPTPEFHLQADPGCSAPILLDQDRIKQVVRNLLENALYAASSPGRVQVKLSQNGDGLIRLSVADDGSGVAPENRENVFTPFYTTKTKGTGLGLALSARLVDAHGGLISVRDAEIGGAEFVVQLPCVSRQER